MSNQTLTLKEFNDLPKARAHEALARCCGADRWVDQMLTRRPFDQFDDLLIAADEAFALLEPKDWLEAFAPLARNANRETQFALPHRLKELGVPQDVALGLAAGAFALGYLWLARLAWRGRARLGLAAGFLLCASPYLVPWYAVWALPVAASEDDPTAQWLAVAISAYLLRQRAPI